MSGVCERAVFQSVRDSKVVGRRRLIASVRCSALDVCGEVDGFWMLRDGCPRSDRSSWWLIGDLIEGGAALQCGMWINVECSSSHHLRCFHVCSTVNPLP